jgi:tRNA threonylcarbamoyladenosine biosynthesis protein TsaE
MTSHHLSFDLLNESDTETMGLHIAKCIESPAVFAFRGDLGAGKTTLIRAMLRSLGITGPIKSPTFSLVESYQLPKKSIELHHFDLYRIEDEAELEFIGFRDYFSHNMICCIEWPERAPNALGAYDVDFSFLSVNDMHRVLKVTAMSALGVIFLSCLSRYYA